MTNSLVPVNFEAMLREISAGGVVLRKAEKGWSIAVIEPQKDSTEKTSRKKSAPKAVFALPKGLVDPGETPEQTAVREVHEETGIIAAPITKLGDIKYVYVRSWGDGQRVFKIVSFYLLRYESGSIDQIAPEMRIEVRRASWIPMDDAGKKLAYRGERDIIRRAQEYLERNPEA
jgi:8-oxo-dGTP pyrophosphatase MutT (NUDIX family)